ncbi:gas vesicle structural protein GvpA [Metabacillus sp. JX24]|uniref:gas vesicle structural protein GvpA n=1 Tax=Metabacillus TaxID=2675233 RepID=UPI00317F5B71
MSIQKSTDSSSLAEVIDRILDKGIVIDAFVRVSLVGIEILTVEARVVIASVDTWLRYAEAVGLLRDEVEEEGLKSRTDERGSQSAFTF